MRPFALFKGRTLSFLLTLLLGLPFSALSSASVLALAGDFAVENEDWTGLSIFAETAKEVGVSLKLIEDADLGHFSEHDFLLLIEPQHALPKRELHRFLEAGGRLLILDKSGRSEDFLSDYGLLRSPFSVSAYKGLEPWEGEEGFYPIEVKDAGPLFYNLHELLSNYPAFFRHDPSLARRKAKVSALLRLDGAGGNFLMAQVEAGKGSVLALSDSSMMINGMLSYFYENKQFSANMLRYLCRREPCVVKVIAADKPIYGHFQEASTPSWSKRWRGFLDGWNHRIEAYEGSLSEKPWTLFFWTLGFVFFLVMLFQKAEGLPFRPPGLSRGSFSLSRQKVRLKAFDAREKTANYALLARPYLALAMRLQEAYLASSLREKDSLKAAWIRVESDCIDLKKGQVGRWDKARFLRFAEDLKRLQEALT